ncbi:hypothetical protein EUGRSUZ_H03568 [Eucalyptus grandis]|uniref:Uncharacterized protein n=2 Tax=Eucalyptus grandis TaxID=71139 RepID=A0ACC3JUC5_EUCGR|nr:hypothetical protein EUGRSUZ_H03568 [Eucalyptus grandis]
MAWQLVVVAKGGWPSVRQGELRRGRTGRKGAAPGQQGQPAEQGRRGQSCRRSDSGEGRHGQRTSGAILLGWSLGWRADRNGSPAKARRRCCVWAEGSAAGEQRTHGFERAEQSSSSVAGGQQRVEEAGSRLSALKTEAAAATVDVRTIGQQGCRGGAARGQLRRTGGVGRRVLQRCHSGKLGAACGPSLGKQGAAAASIEGGGWRRGLLQRADLEKRQPTRGQQTGGVAASWLGRSSRSGAGRGRAETGGES